MIPKSCPNKSKHQKVFIRLPPIHIFSVLASYRVIKKETVVRCEWQIHMKMIWSWLNLHLNSSTICLWSIFDCRCSQRHRHHTLSVCEKENNLMLVIIYFVPLFPLLFYHFSFFHNILLSLLSAFWHSTLSNGICIKIYAILRVVKKGEKVCLFCIRKTNGNLIDFKACVNGWFSVCFRSYASQ